MLVNLVHENSISIKLSDMIWYKPMMWNSSTVAEDLQSCTHRLLELTHGFLFSIMMIAEIQYISCCLLFIQCLSYVLYTVMICTIHRSLSFILVMGGTAFLLLSLMYFCIDTIKWWNGVPFIYPGVCTCV